MPANRGIMKINSALACTLKKKRKEEERCDLASLQTLISAHVHIYYMCGIYVHACVCNTCIINEEHTQMTHTSLTSVVSAVSVT